SAAPRGRRRCKHGRVADRKRPPRKVPSSGALARRRRRIDWVGCWESRPVLVPKPAVSPLPSERRPHSQQDFTSTEGASPRLAGQKTTPFLQPGNDIFITIGIPSAGDPTRGGHPWRLVRGILAPLGVSP